MCGYNIKVTTNKRKNVAYFYNSHKCRRLVTSDELRDIYEHEDTIAHDFKGDVVNWFKSVHPDQDVTDYKEFDEYSIRIDTRCTDRLAGGVDSYPRLMNKLHKYFMNTYAAGKEERFSSSSGMNYSEYHYDTDNVNLTTFNSSTMTVVFRVPYSQEKVVLNGVYEILLKYGDIVF